MSWKVHFVEDAPEVVDGDAVYFVGHGSGSYGKCACPHGQARPECKGIDLPNLREGMPNEIAPETWYVVGQDPASIVPSIIHTPCKCHFSIVNGEVRLHD